MKPCPATGQKYIIAFFDIRFKTGLSGKKKGAVLREKGEKGIINTEYRKKKREDHRICA